MAKRNRSVNQNTNRRRTAEKRGTGRLADYTPWLKIQDVAAQTTVTRIRGWKTGRIHHILSQLELDYFYLLDWSMNVIDIREQFPLDLNETTAIAENTGLVHPADSVSKEAATIVTGFLVTIQRAFGTIDSARSITHSKSLGYKSTIEKLEIERRYWAFRSIDWGIVTEQDINSVLVKNIAWIHSFIDSANLAPLTNELVQKAENILLPAVKKGGIPLRDITNNCDEKLNLSPGSALGVIRHLIAARRLKVDMSAELIQPANPLRLIV